MSVNPIEPVGSVPIDTYTTYFARPLISATGTEHVAATEQIDSNGRTLSISESVLLVYNRFENLQTLNQLDPSTIRVDV